MKLTKFANLLAIGLVLSFAVTGCQSGKKGTTPLPPYEHPSGTNLSNGETVKPATTEMRVAA